MRNIDEPTLKNLVSLTLMFFNTEFGIFRLCEGSRKISEKYLYCVWRVHMQLIAWRCWQRVL